MLRTTERAVWRATQYPGDLVTLLEQQFSQERAILPGDAGDERSSRLFISGDSVTARLPLSVVWRRAHISTLCAVPKKARSTAMDDVADDVAAGGLRSVGWDEPVADRLELLLRLLVVVVASDIQPVVVARPSPYRLARSDQAQDQVREVQALARLDK